jgi:hypothetical protein
MIRGFEEERFRSALTQRWDEVNYAVGWGEVQWELSTLDSLLKDAEVKDNSVWRKLFPDEKLEIYCAVYNIAEDKRELYRKYFI